MPLESATFISQLNPSNPAAGDLKSEGDDQIRLVKSVLQAQFPSLGATAVTATATQINSVTSAAQRSGDTYTGTHNFTGAVLNVPTASASDNDSSVASTAMVQAAILASSGITASLPSQTGNAGRVLVTDGTSSSWADYSKTIQILTTGTSWVCPAGVRKVKVRGVGAGGSGGQSSGSLAGSGGGGGGYFEKIVSVTPGNSYTYAIGSGGPAQGSSNTNGTAGGNTTFNDGVTTYTASGGGAGQASSVISSGGIATNGDLNVTGGRGIGGWGSTYSMAGGSVFGPSFIASNGASGASYGQGGVGTATGTGSGAGFQGAIILEY